MRPLKLATCLLSAGLTVGCTTLNRSAPDRTSPSISNSSLHRDVKLATAVESTRVETIEVSSVQASDSSLANFQRSLLYFPAKTQSLAAAVTKSQLPIVDLEVTTHDQLTLNGWLISSDNRRTAAGPGNAGSPTPETSLVLIFPGNAGHRGARMPLIEAIRSVGVDVMIFDYRGYGDNAGEPAEIHLVQDSRSIWNLAIEKLHHRARRIIIYGESLGGGVATRLAGDLCESGIQPGGLIVQSSFNSVIDAGRHHFPILPVNLMSVDRFDSQQHITKITCPYLHLHGEKDSVVPLALGRKLFQAAPETSAGGIAKRLVVLPNSNHNDVYDVDRQRALGSIQKFVDTVARQKVDNE